MSADTHLNLVCLIINFDDQEHSFVVTTVGGITPEYGTHLVVDSIISRWRPPQYLFPGRLNKGGGSLTPLLDQGVKFHPGPT